MQSLRHLIESPTLQWIFVGGKGGVGKTTTSSSLAILLARTPIHDAALGGFRDRKVIIISTDPAHNLSDAFSQKFTKAPTPVEGVHNLWAMEVDPTLVTEAGNFDSITFQGALGELAEEEQQGLISIANIVRDAAKTLPGIDEVTVLAQILREVKASTFDTVVFDTAPTGHTLRLISLPTTLAESVDRVLDVHGLSNLIQTASEMMTTATGVASSTVATNLNRWRAMIKDLQEQFSDNSKTTFVCVCIPEFLSVYETERLIQELTKYNISCEDIVVNQLVMKPSAEPPCRMCEARRKIQQKYLAQIEELYEDFHIVRMPLQGDEVRSVPSLLKFSQFLIEAYDPDKHGYL